MEVEEMVVTRTRRTRTRRDARGQFARRPAGTPGGEPLPLQMAQNLSGPPEAGSVRGSTQSATRRRWYTGETNEGGE